MSNIDVLEFLTEPATGTEGFHGIVYGPPGVGKTSTLDDPKFKVCQIDIEGGSAVLQGAPNVKRFDIPAMTAEINERTKGSQTQFETFMQVGKAIELGKLGDFDLISPDSLTSFEDIVKEYVAKKLVPNRKREVQGRFGAQSDWGDLANLIANTMRWFHSFTKRGEKSVHVLWMAHVLEVRNEMTNALETTKVNLQGSKTPDVVMSIVDGYFYMYNKSVLSEDKQTSSIERGILTARMGGLDSKARQPKRMDKLPPRIIDPVWSDIFEQMGYVRK